MSGRAGRPAARGSARGRRVRCRFARRAIRLTAAPTEPPLVVRITGRAPAGAAAVRRWLVAAAQRLGRTGTIEVALVDDRAIAALHGRFLGNPTPTDVLAFDFRDDPCAAEPTLDGVIVASVETAAREAARRGLPPAEELARYLVHGLLHLCGEDDREPAARRRMRRRERALLAHLGL